MNTEVLPALAALGGGSVLIGSIYVAEKKRESAMRADRVHLKVRFPAGLDEATARAAISGLTGIGTTNELVVETIATGSGITFGLIVPRTAAAATIATLSSTVPGIRLEDAEPISGLATIAASLYVPRHVVLRDDDAGHGARAMLGVLGRLHDEDETVAVRWALRPGRPSPPPARTSDEDADRQALRRTLEGRANGPGLVASGLVMVRATSITRARDLLNQVTAVIGARQARHGGIRPTIGRGRSLAALPKTTRTSGWLSAGQLLPLLAVPLGTEPIHNVEAGGARERLAGRDVARTGRVLFVGRDVHGERPIALSPTAARHHLGIIGPSGVGKSELVETAIVSDIKAGHGGVALDGKGDALDPILDRTGADADRIIVIDPGDLSRPTPGIDVLHAGNPDLAADVFLGVLGSLFESTFGIRTQLWGRLGLRTLAATPGTTLVQLGRLFSDPAFRRRALANLDDEVALSQWADYESLSPNAKAEHVQSPMAKVSTLLSRPAVRAVLSNPDPTISIDEIIAERKWLLVSLSPALIGDAAAKLIGAALMHATWVAVENRAKLRPEQRHPAFIYIDEFASLATLPISFELLAERSRGLGVGLCVAFQTLRRIPPDVRSSLMGNFASVIAFRSNAEEAPLLAREMPGLDARDLQSLGRFEVAARIGTSGAGAGVAVVTGRTEPLPPSQNTAEMIRDRSAAKYGSPLPAKAAPAPAAEPDSDLPLGRGRSAS